MNPSIVTINVPAGVVVRIPKIEIIFPAGTEEDAFLKEAGFDSPFLFDSQSKGRADVGLLNTYSE